MARSLKEQYTQRKLQQLQERTRQADKQLLAETKFTRLLLEAMDEEDLQKVSAIVDKLDTIKTPELPSLTAAIEQAQAELNKYTGGGPITKAWAKLKSKVGIDNPVVKITTFADALERGFSQIPTILKNNGVNLAKADLNKSLASTLTKKPTGMKSDKDMEKSPVTGKDVPGNEKINPPKPRTGEKSDSQLGRSPFTGKQVPDNEEIQVPEGAEPRVDEAPKAPSGEEKMKNIVTQLRKALSPGGIFGVFKKVPYIDSDSLAKELVAAPLKVFSNISKRIQAGAKAAEIASDMKSQIQGQGDEETKQAGAAEPTKPAGQSQPGAPSKPTTATTGTTGTGEQPGTAPGATRGGGGNVRGGADKIVSDSGAKDKESAYAVLRHLIKAGLLSKDALAKHAGQKAA
jgi:hypothetical protein